MSAANKVQANKPITQTGALGYLLWLRKDLPAVYSSVAKQYADVANFESALKRQTSGLGDDDDTDYGDSVVSDFSSGGASSDPVIIVPTMTIDPPVITIAAPDVPAIPTPTVDSTGPAATVASGVSASTLTSIAATVGAIIPAALKTATAVINSQTAAKAAQTAQVQLAAALAGRSPLQTGLVTTANGSQYLTALTAPGGALASSGVLGTNLYGLPLYAWLAAGLGLVLLAANVAE